MESGSRKATDIILELEKQVKQLTAVIASQDLLLKVISNKLSELLNNSQKLEAPKFTVEAINSIPQNNIFAQSINIDPERQIPISSEDTLLEEKSPNGFRRTSRPETFAGDNAYLNKITKKKEEEISFPVQIPKPNGQNEVVIPDINLNNKTKQPKQTLKQVTSGNSIPTIQRIVDRNGKSVFLADVEIIDLSTIETIVKTRTNGTGKWQASLPIGEYKVIIKKLESLTKQKVEVSQNVRVDGTQSPLELQMMIIK